MQSTSISSKLLVCLTASCLLHAVFSVNPQRDKHGNPQRDKGGNPHVQVMEAVESKPSFCKWYSCPTFTATSVGNKMESRTYSGTSQWVSTSVIVDRSSLSWSGPKGMFQKLFSYISGANDQGMKMAMTVPVVNQFEELPNNKVKVTQLFYLAVDSPPSPTDSRVQLTTLPQNMFVRMFGSNLLFMLLGFENMEGMYASNLDTLRGAVEEREGVWYTVAYDEPWAFFRHNEVWLADIAN